MSEFKVSVDFQLAEQIAAAAKNGGQGQKQSL
jgi:hypothetical protein